MIVGILAHVDAGKTTLAEQLLFQSGTIRSAGRVDQKNAFLDHAEIEKERGITVFSDQAVLELDGQKHTLVDTPGHVDFSGEMERSLWIMDCAILVVSCVEGVQGHTQTVWRLLRSHNIPTILFFNKTDRDSANPSWVLEDFKTRFHADCLDITDYFEAPPSEEWAEQLAMLDETLLEDYLEQGYQKEKWENALVTKFWEGTLYPVVCGSALSGTGVKTLLKGLSLFGQRKQENQTPGDALRAQVYQVRHDKSGGRVVYLKVNRGALHPKDEILLHTAEGSVIEKVNEVRIYHGARYTLADEIQAGELCAVTGLRIPKPGDLLGDTPAHQSFELQPLLTARVLHAPELHPNDVLGAFRLLEDEEPLLRVVWNEALQEIQLCVMGKIQLEVIQELMQSRYHMAVSFGPCEILYQETLAEPVNGCGHFEPLRHYAEVHLRLEPGKRGSGITFDSECPKDLLASNWQNLIRTHVLEKEHKGVLTGAPLTDVRIVLLKGRAHLKHTEGGDFREATYRAVRQGLMSGRSVLLEPYYAFEIEVDYPLCGRVLSDVQRMNGTFESPQEQHGFAVIHGRAPAACMMGYPAELTALTKGEGRLSLTFDGYESCGNAEKIIEGKNYQPERDIENTPDSVFCSHGAGYPVKWYDAPAHMHLSVR